MARVATGRFNVGASGLGYHWGKSDFAGIQNDAGGVYAQSL